MGRIRPQGDPVGLGKRYGIVKTENFVTNPGIYLLCRRYVSVKECSLVRISQTRFLFPSPNRSQYLSTLGHDIGGINDGIDLRNEL